MDEQPAAPSTFAAPNSPEPTLLDLGIDRTWGTDQTIEPPSHEVSVDGVHGRPRWSPLGWFRRRREQADLANSVDELADEATEMIDLSPDPFWKTGLKTIAAFFGSAVLAYVILTFPSQWVKVVYAAEHFGKSDAPSTIVKTDATSGNFQDVVVPSLSFRPPAPSISPAPAPSSTPSNPFASLGDNQIIIPKISVTAPIIWDSSFDEKIMLQNLQKGVVHYGGTDLPNPTTGNVFITGHSSYYWWDPGKFKTVFAVLNQVRNGDQIALTYQHQVYVYQVYESIVVKPTDVSVLATSTKPILSLMTCTPVGTSLNRLIVHANLVGVFTEGATSAPTSATDSAATQPAASTNASTGGQSTTTTPATPTPTSNSNAPTTPPPTSTGPTQNLDLLPGLDSWIGR